MPRPVRRTVGTQTEVTVAPSSSDDNNNDDDDKKSGGGRNRIITNPVAFVERMDI